MEGMSEREYATHAGLSRGATQKAKTSGRIVLHADGSIDAAASDARRAAATDPSKVRRDRGASGAAKAPRTPATAAEAAAEAGAGDRGLGRRRDAA